MSVIFLEPQPISNAMNSIALIGPPCPTPQPRHLSSRLGRLVAVSCWIYLVILLGLWLGLSWGDTWWPATLIMFTPRLVLALPVVVLFPAALLLRRRALPVLGIACFLLVGPLMGCCIPWHSVMGPPPRGAHFRVLTCNMHYGRQDSALVDQLVITTQPDFVALQEWSGSRKSALLTDPDWHCHWSPKQFLASRYPIVRTMELGHDSESAAGSVTRYDLETPAGVVVLFSLHFASPREGVSTVVHHPGVSENIQANSALRWEQSLGVARQASTVTGPVLLVGDFNTPPESVIFRHVWDRYTDAFSAAGWGWGYTFLSGRTMVRIDHILASKEWYCSRCRVGPNIGSPHRPVIADLICPDSAGSAACRPDLSNVVFEAIAQQCRYSKTQTRTVTITVLHLQVITAPVWC